MSIFKRSKSIARANLYDYSTKEGREDTVAFLMDSMLASNTERFKGYAKCKAYYDGEHDSEKYMGSLLGSLDIPWTPSLSTDAYIHVESQIDSSVPDFEFSPREISDSAKAKRREYITRYVVDKNDLSYKNFRNERNIGILGSAVFKVSITEDSRGKSDVLVETPSPEQIFADPTATSVDACEYIAYCYPMHINKAMRVFREDIERAGLSASDIQKDLYEKHRFKNPFGGNKSVIDSDFYGDMQTVTITEFWFRQQTDGSAIIQTDKGSVDYRYKSGDIGLIILIGSHEIRYVPKYWTTTGCTMYPFCIYNRTPTTDTLFGKSELLQLIPLIDSADREMIYAQLNSAFCANDIVVAEENAFAEGEGPDNRPGAVWKLRPGMMGKVQRLGNLGYAEASLYSNVKNMRELMRETVGNYSSFQGEEPEKVTTATGIALLNERAKTRKQIKLCDKLAAYARLYSLVDRSALECFEDGRYVLLGAPDDRSGGLVFNISDYGGKNGYIPEVDVKIHVGDGLQNSKAFTVSALSDLIKTPINQDNYKLVEAFIELIGLPVRGEITDILDKKYSHIENGGTNEQ